MWKRNLMRVTTAKIRDGVNCLNMVIISRFSANKALVLTVPALCNFGIIARYNCFGGGGAFLPHRARGQRHNAGVDFVYHWLPEPI